jgi:hypothetical protein
MADNEFVIVNDNVNLRVLSTWHYYQSDRSHERLLPT